jgi:uncharacterized protein (DUF302 family)
MFYASREFNADLEDVMSSFLVHIKKDGFVIIADVNVTNILKNALNFEFKDYHILEICKPAAAKEIIEQDDLNGLFVPCKMIIFQVGKVTSIRVLSVSQITDQVYPNASALIKKFERELFGSIESFTI